MCGGVAEDLAATVHVEEWPGGHPSGLGDAGRDVVGSGRDGDSRFLDAGLATGTASAAWSRGSLQDGLPV